MISFKSFFSKKKSEPEHPALSDLSVFKTDIHSHLIPGIDDGVKTMEESIEMITALSKLGFTKLITTPHIMSDYFKNTPEIIMEGLKNVREEIKKQGIPIELDAAAEYYVDEHFLQKIKEENILTFGGKYVLFEISYINPPDTLSSIIFELTIRGYIPVLAHPERYPFWYQKFDEFYKLKEAGTLFQLNTNSLVGYYGMGAKKIAEKMLDENMIDFIGSDLHGKRHLDALQKVVAEKYAWKLAAQGVRNTEL
ncbi:MAG: capsular biosynthesis protein [Bacteroidia bacterium]|nr:capsular biosynthesis protein [Bacteroidia bacterium]